MRLMVTIAYDGHKYHGWQVQDNATSIQKEVEKALSVVTKTDIRIHASGRTDTGVHAYGQVFHFDTDLTIPARGWMRSLNALLPKDIRIVNIEDVDDSFHARYSAKSKTYIYRINTGTYNVFDINYVYQYCRPIDLSLVDALAKIMVGTHDFGSFNATPFDVVEDQVKTIHIIEGYYENDVLVITFKGSGFLRHMVRVLVGTLIALSENKIENTKVKASLEHPNKDEIPYIVPGCGLYLHSVTY